MAKLAPGGSSQANESFNSIVISKTPKAKFYGGSASLNSRVAAAVSQKNLETAYSSQTFKKLSMSPGILTEKARKRKDALRYRIRILKNSERYKSRRLFVKKQRSQQRRGMEQREGVSYLADVGFLQAPDASTLPSGSACPELDNRVLVYFDIETTGLHRNCEIIQVAGKCAGSGTPPFSVYAKPSHSISATASAITGLSVVDGELFHRGQGVAALPVEDALQKFLDFLRSVGENVVLAGHNAFAFDVPRLLDAMKRNGLGSSFEGVVWGVADTLPLMRSLHKEDKEKWKKEPTYKLSALAEKYVAGYDASGAHEATSDVLALEGVCKTLDIGSALLSHSVPLSVFVRSQQDKAKNAQIALGLAPLAGSISKGIIAKMAAAGVTIDKLRDVFAHGGQEGIWAFLSENIGSGKPRVTNSARVIKSVVGFFNK